MTNNVQECSNISENFECLLSNLERWGTFAGNISEMFKRKKRMRFWTTFFCYRSLRSTRHNPNMAYGLRFYSNCNFHILEFNLLQLSM